MRRLFVILLLIICFACSSSLQMQDRDVLTIVNSKYGKWVSQWESGQLTDRELIIGETKRFEPTVAFQHAQKRFQNCSPTGIDCVDIYSGSYDFAPTDDSISINGEPQSLIIFSHNNIDSILLNYGYSIVLQDVFWLSSKEFVVMGFEILETKLYKPTIWIFDLTSRSYKIIYLKPAHFNVAIDYVLKKFNH